jgi:hypothetical protein
MSLKSVRQHQTILECWGSGGIKKGVRVRALLWACFACNIAFLAIFILWDAGEFLFIFVSDRTFEDYSGQKQITPRAQKKKIDNLC